MNVSSSNWLESMAYGLGKCERKIYYTILVDVWIVHVPHKITKQIIISIYDRIVFLRNTLSMCLFL